MMNKIIIGMSALGMAWILASCSQDEDPAPQPRRVEMTLRVGAEVPATESAMSPAAEGGQHRTMLKPDMKTVGFLQNDDLSVFDYENNNQYFVRSDNGGDGALTAQFRGMVVVNQKKAFHALFPYQEGAQCVSNSGKNYIRAVIPTEQMATAGSFDPKANLSVAAFMPDEKGNSTSFTLRNACALVRLSIVGSCTTVRLESVDAKQCTGTYLIGPIESAVGATTDEAFVDEVTASAPKASYVELVAPQGGAITDGTYYMVLSPKATSRMKITFTNADGKSVSRTTKDNVSVGQGLITDLGSFTLPK